MVQICEFNVERDICAVEQSGYLDLAAANATSSIPSGISNSELQFNEINDPRSIAGTPSDTFEAMQMASNIAGYEAPKKDE